MNAIRIALIQTTHDPAPGAMATKYAALIAEAAATGAKLIVLPEFSLTAHPAAGAELVPEPVPGGEGCRVFAELGTSHGVFVVGSVYERGGVGFRKQRGARFDTTVLFDPAGTFGGGCREQHARDAGGDESRAGRGNSDYPLFALPDAVVALPGGDDAYFPELARIYGLKGAELLLFPSAVPAAMAGAWETMLRSHAVANGVFVAAANRAGAEGGSTWAGGSVIVAPDGEVLARGATEGDAVVSVELDPARIVAAREAFPFLLRREPETYGVLMARLTLREAA